MKELIHIYSDHPEKEHSLMYQKALVAELLRENERLKVEWNKYKEFLQEKYPAGDNEEWQFTCDFHRKIDQLLNQQEQ